MNRGGNGFAFRRGRSSRASALLSRRGGGRITAMKKGPRPVMIGGPKPVRPSN